MSEEMSSLGKALSALEAIASAGAPPTTAELAAALGMPRPTVYRIVKALTAQGYLMQGPDGRLHVGFAVLPLAAGLLDRIPLRIHAIPHLEHLAEKTGHRTNLAVLHSGKVMILGGCERPGLPRIYSHFGNVVPPHASGLGKAVISRLEEDEVKMLLGAEPFARRTGRTATTLPAVLKEREASAARGYAVEDGESTTSSFCIAAPLVVGERPIGAISISGRQGQDMHRFAPDLLQCAELISHLAQSGFTDEPLSFGPQFGAGDRKHEGV